MESLTAEGGAWARRRLSWPGSGRVNGSVWWLRAGCRHRRTAFRRLTSFDLRNRKAVARTRIRIGLILTRLLTAYVRCRADFVLSFPPHFDWRPRPSPQSPAYTNTITCFSGRSRAVGSLSFLQGRRGKSGELIRRAAGVRRRSMSEQDSQFSSKVNNVVTAAGR